MAPNETPHCCGLTDIGRVREENQDQFLIAELGKSLVVHDSTLKMEHDVRLFSGSQGQLLLVADGMGGMAAGRRASELTVDTVTQHVLRTMPWFYRLHEEHDDELFEALKRAVADCEAVVDAEARSMPGHRGMGTTLTMAYVLWPRLYVVHVGDSRCYLLRGSKLDQITRDHTVAQQLADRGDLAPENIRDSRYSHVLYNAVGVGPDRLGPEVYKAELEPGDVLLLCTDGLIRHVSDETLVELLQGRGSAAGICRDLVGAANESGGSDNVTVIVARYEGAGVSGEGS